MHTNERYLQSHKHIECDDNKKPWSIYSLFSKFTSRAYDKGENFYQANRLYYYLFLCKLGKGIKGICTVYIISIKKYDFISMT